MPGNTMLAIVQSMAVDRCLLPLDLGDLRDQVLLVFALRRCADRRRLDDCNILPGVPWRSMQRCLFACALWENHQERERERERASERERERERERESESERERESERASESESESESEGRRERRREVRREGAKADRR